MPPMIDQILGPRAILIIGDSPFQNKVLRAQLEQSGPFEVLEALTLEEANHLLRARGAELLLVLTDLNLPDAPNGEAVDLCLSWRIPIMVLTATFDETLRESFIQRRVVDYFLKGGAQHMAPLLHSVQRIYKNQAVDVLLVNDAPAQREYLRDLLHVQRLNVLEAEDGLDALEALQEVPSIRLVITDDNMPRMDGLELTRQLRTHYSSEQLGIIGVSSMDSSLVTAQFLKCGANEYLREPFSPTDFYWRVNQTLDRMDLCCPAPPSLEHPALSDEND